MVHTDLKITSKDPVLVLVGYRKVSDLLVVDQKETRSFTSFRACPELAEGTTLVFVFRPVFLPTLHGIKKRTTTCNRYKGSQVKARDPSTGRLVRLFNPQFASQNADEIEKKRAKPTIEVEGSIVEGKLALSLEKPALNVSVRDNAIITPYERIIVRKAFF